MILLLAIWVYEEAWFILFNYTPPLDGFIAYKIDSFNLQNK